MSKQIGCVGYGGSATVEMFKECFLKHGHEENPMSDIVTGEIRALKELEDNIKKAADSYALSLGEKGCDESKATVEFYEAMTQAFAIYNDVPRGFMQENKKKHRTKILVVCPEPSDIICELAIWSEVLREHLEKGVRSNREARRITTPYVIIDFVDHTPRTIGGYKMVMRHNARQEDQEYLLRLAIGEEQWRE